MLEDSLVQTADRPGPTFDGINVCGDGECECGMIWDTEADLHIATVHGSAKGKYENTLTEEGRRRWSRILGAAASSAKKVHEAGYDPESVAERQMEMLEAIEEAKKVLGRERDALEEAFSNEKEQVFRSLREILQAVEED